MNSGHDYGSESVVEKVSSICRATKTIVHKMCWLAHKDTDNKSID